VTCEPASRTLAKNLYDALIGDAEATWALVIGSLRLLGAAHAEVVECIADGAEWMWDRTERLTRLAEIPTAKLVEVLDFYRHSGLLLESYAACLSSMSLSSQ